MVNFTKINLTERYLPLNFFPLFTKDREDQVKENLILRNDLLFQNKLVDTYCLFKESQNRFHLFLEFFHLFLTRFH